jgi:hypothetical protein
MFRTMAIALVAASVFTAPVLAQNNTLSGGSSNSGSKNAPSTPAPTGESPEKTEKPDKAEKSDKSAESTEKSEKTITHHHHVARHHHHGTKVAKVSKTHTHTAISTKHHGARGYAKYEGRHAGRSRIAKYPRHTGRAYGRGSKRPSVD